MTLNTVKDFLDTINPETPGITCPACGSILGLRKQGSTEMVLTENARLELDGFINIYRRYVEALEALLEQRNISFDPLKSAYPYEREKNFYERYNNSLGSSIEFLPGGVYAAISAEGVAKKFVEEYVDFFQWIENFSSFPRKNSQDKKSIYQKCKDVLIPGLEPRSMLGPLMDLVFDQSYVADWVQKIRSDDEGFDKLDSLLTEVCPSIQWYLDTLFKVGGEFAREAEFNNLDEGILRVQVILAIILGHRSKNNVGTLWLKDLNIDTKVPFSLPRSTVVSPRRIFDLLRSEVVLGNPQIGLSNSLLKTLKKKIDLEMGDDLSSVSPSSDQVVEILEVLKTEIHKFVHFACTGPASDKQIFASLEALEKNIKGDSEFCGWYPKVNETHSVILLGSPGTGKSSVMLTGFTAFYNNAPELGATVSFDSPEDETMMKLLVKNYWVGEMPKPTKKGTRTTIKVSIEFPETDLYEQTNFVFTDIAGEIVARSLKDEGSDPSVLRILKNAETIIFFFDLSIEPSILKRLTEGDDGFWTGVNKNYEKVKESRKFGDSESNAEVSQIQLLQKLIKDLRSQKGVENLRDGKTNFICVIPKSDLFAGDYTSSEERYFFSKLFGKLREAGIFVRSNYYKEESFVGYFSLGGTAVKDDDTIDPVERQKRLGRRISDWTLESFRGIGNALTGVEEALKVSFANTLKVGLIATLHSFFGRDNVYFLPVSAQGEDSDKLNLGHPPNQKLSEYVFILPVALSAKRKEQPQPSEPEPKIEPQRSGFRFRQ